MKTYLSNVDTHLVHVDELGVVTASLNVPEKLASDDEDGSVLNL